MTKGNNNSKWEAAVEAYDNPGSQKAKGAKKGNKTTARGSVAHAPQESANGGKVKKPPKIRPSYPNLQTHRPFIRTTPGASGSTLANRSDEAQARRLPKAFEERLRAAYARIPTYEAPVTLAELKSLANSVQELQRCVPIVRKLVKEGKVTSSSTRVVDPDTKKTIFLYLGKRYGDDKDQYENKEGLGNPDQLFKKPMEIGKASSRKYLMEQMRKAESKYTIVHDGFHPKLIDAYNKAVHAMAYVNPPNRDQTPMRHGALSEGAEGDQSLHRFPITPDVRHTSHRTAAGLRNTRDSEPGLVYSDKPGEGCEPSGVWHFIEGREQIGHRGQGLYMAKDMCDGSAATTAVQAMYKATETLESNVETVIKLAFPDEYPQMKSVWEAGKVMERNSGCHIARAIVFKLPVLPHWDDTDFGTSLSFPAGDFLFGYLYIPQFDLVFEYGPGSLAAFHADCIIHSVGDWETPCMQRDAETTPGRIGTVFYIPRSSATVLADKERGWGARTNYGRWIG